jgi:hypothetical protein
MMRIRYNDENSVEFVPKEIKVLNQAWNEHLLKTSPLYLGR